MEIWKQVIGYEGIYEVSNLGNIKSIGRYRFVKRNMSKCFFKELILKSGTSNGYLGVILNKECFRKRFSTHRLVAEAFIPNPENKPQVNHINGIKKDNRVQNLEWNTASENTQHAIKLGLLKILKGENRYNSKLKKDDVLFIRNSILKTKYLAEIYKVDQRTIRNVKNKKSYNNI